MIRVRACAAVLSMLTPVGCARGQAQMVGTSAESAEDARRLKAMIDYCIALSGDGIVEPLVSVTPAQAAAAAAVYLRQYFAANLEREAPSGTTAEMRGRALARAVASADRTAACLRGEYDVPAPAGSQLLRNDPGAAARDKATADLFGNMGRLGP